MSCKRFLTVCISLFHGQTVKGAPVETELHQLAGNRVADDPPNNARWNGSMDSICIAQVMDALRTVYMAGLGHIQKDSIRPIRLATGGVVLSASSESLTVWIGEAAVISAWNVNGPAANNAGPQFVSSITIDEGVAAPAGVDLDISSS